MPLRYPAPNAAHPLRSKDQDGEVRLFDLSWKGDRILFQDRFRLKGSSKISEKSQAETIEAGSPRMIVKQNVGNPPDT